MVRSGAGNPDEYLAELPADRRETVSAVRDLVLRNLPPGYVESMNWGMLTYEIPLSRYADTYNGQPLGYVGLASQKNYITLYLMGAYAVPKLSRKLETAFRDAGKRFDMGRSCLHFRTMEDLEVDVLAEIIAAVPVERYIEQYEASRARTGAKRKPAAKRKTAAGKKSATERSSALKKTKTAAKRKSTAAPKKKAPAVKTTKKKKATAKKKTTTKTKPAAKKNARKRAGS